MRRLGGRGVWMWPRPEWSISWHELVFCIAYIIVFLKPILIIETEVKDF